MASVGKQLVVECNEAKIGNIAALRSDKKAGFLLLGFNEKKQASTHTTLDTKVRAEQHAAHVRKEYKEHTQIYDLSLRMRVA